MGTKEEKSCQALLQEYWERLLWASSQEPSGFSENLYPTCIERSQGLSGPYCSKKPKAEIWALLKVGRDTQEMKVPNFQCNQKGSCGQLRAQRNHVWMLWDRFISSQNSL